MTTGRSPLGIVCSRGTAQRVVHDPFFLWTCCIYVSALTHIRDCMDSVNEREREREGVRANERKKERANVCVCVCVCE